MKRRRSLVGAAALLLLGSVPSDLLTVDGYLRLTIDLMRQGVAGWQEIVDAGQPGEASSAAVDAIKARMLAEEEKTLRKHGVTKEQLTSFVTEHRKEITDRLAADEEKSGEINELSLELNRLLGEYLRLTAEGSQDGADERR